jgi:cytochrome P450
MVNVFLPCAVAIQMTPRIFRPMIGGAFKMWIAMHKNVHVRLLTPVIQQELVVEEVFDYAQATPTTLIAALIQEVRKTPGGAEMSDSKWISDLISAVNFAAIATTPFNCTGVLLKILSYRRSGELVSAIRNEAVQLFASGVSGETLNAMTVLDSVCRETLRLEVSDLFLASGTVTTPVETPDGVRLPCGTRVALPLYGIHHDKTLYGKDAMAFNPYRFCPRNGEKQILAHDMSDKFMPFSQGTRVSNFKPEPTKLHVKSLIVFL